MSAKSSPTRTHRKGKRNSPTSTTSSNTGESDFVAFGKTKRVYNSPEDETERAGQFAQHTIIVPVRTILMDGADTVNTRKMFRSNTVFRSPVDTTTLTIMCHAKDPNYVSIRSVLEFILYNAAHLRLINELTMAWVDSYNCDFVDIQDIYSMIIFNDAFWARASPYTGFFADFMAHVITPFRAFVCSANINLRAIFFPSPSYIALNPITRFLGVYYKTRHVGSRYVRLPMFTTFNGLYPLTTTDPIFPTIQRMFYDSSADNDNQIYIIDIMRWLCSFDIDNFCLRVDRSNAYFLNKNIRYVDATSPEMWKSLLNDKELFAWVWHDVPQYANIDTNPALVYLRAKKLNESMHATFDPQALVTHILDSAMAELNKIIEEANQKLLVIQGTHDAILIDKPSKRQRSQ
jgi:hypothetical protein